MNEFLEPLATMFDTASDRRYLRIVPQEPVRVVALFVDGTERPTDAVTIMPGQEGSFILPVDTSDDSVVGAYAVRLADDKLGRHAIGGEVQPPTVAAVTRIEPGETITSTLNPCSRISRPPMARLLRFGVNVDGPMDDLVITSIRIGAEEQLITGHGVPAAMLLKTSFGNMAPRTICAGVLLTVTWKHRGRTKKRITLSGDLVFDGVETPPAPTPTGTPYSYPPGYGVYPRPNFGGRH